MTEKTCVFNGKTIRYFVAGKGNPIVFLHGFLETAQIWDAFSTFFSGKAKVICLDLPGHGGTASFGEINRMNEMADCLAAVLRLEKCSNAVVVGHSMGGYAALAFAERYTELCKGICLLHSTAFDDSEEKKADRLRAIRVLEMNPSVFIREAIPHLFAPQNAERFANEINSLKNAALNTSVEGAAACLRGMRLREDKTKWIAKGKMPVLFIAGKYDQVVPLEKSLEQMQLHPSVKGLVLEDSGHMGFIEEKEKCLNAIDAFFTLCN